MKARFPDFLVIGAGKSGTTSLNNYLKQHPDIYIPERKEPNFFAYELVDRSQIKDDEDLLQHYDGSITNLENYLDLFKDARQGQFVGETSNIYLYDPQAAKQIQKHVPSCKFIAVLRNPVDRLFSRYLHLASENRAPKGIFADMFDKNSNWWKRPDLVREGFYYANLTKFMSYFDEKQLLVILHEDFSKHPKETLKRIYSFIGVNDDFETDTDVRFNQSGFVKNRVLHDLFSGDGMLFMAMKRIIPSLYIKAQNNSHLRKLLSNVHSKNLYRPKLDAALRKKMIDQIYGEDIDKLSNYLNLNLDHWKR